MVVGGRNDTPEIERAQKRAFLRESALTPAELRNNVSAVGLPPIPPTTERWPPGGAIRTFCLQGVYAQLAYVQTDRPSRIHRLVRRWHDVPPLHELRPPVAGMAGGRHPVRGPRRPATARVPTVVRRFAAVGSPAGLRKSQPRGRSFSRILTIHGNDDPRICNSSSTFGTVFAAPNPRAHFRRATAAMTESRQPNEKQGRRASCMSPKPACLRASQDWHQHCRY